MASKDAFLDIVKSRSSIMHAVLKPTGMLRQSFQAEVDSFCILNRVFGTDLIGFGPSDL